MNISPAFKAACARAAAFFREHPEGWCRGDYALDAQNQYVTPQDQRAVKWCALGRRILELGRRSTPQERDAVRAIGVDLSWINDTEGREAAIAALDRLAGGGDRLISKRERDDVREHALTGSFGKPCVSCLKMAKMLPALAKAEARVVRAAMAWRLAGIKTLGMHDAVVSLANACAALAKIEAKWKEARKQ